MKIELEDSDVERIAAAVAKLVNGKAPATSSSGEKAETAAEEKTETAAEKKKRLAAEAKKNAPAEVKEDDAAAVQKRRAEILETKVKPLGEKHGRDKVKDIISNFADGFANVKASDFDSLVAELDKLDAPDGGDGGEDDY